MRKIFTTVLVAAVCSFVLIGCVDYSLKRQVKAINKQCPIDLGLLGKVTYVDLDERTIVYHVDINPNVLNISKLKGHLKDVKQGILLNFSDDETSLAQFIAAKCNLRYEYTDSETREQLVINISADELKNLNALVGNPQELAQRRIENFVTTGRLQLPMQIDEVTTLSDIIIEGENVGYIYTIDETVVKSDVINERLDVLRDNIKERLLGEDLSMAMLVDALTKGGKGLIYRYFMSESKKQYDIVFTPEEVAELQLQME